jgi:hypothetical protein
VDRMAELEVQRNSPNQMDHLHGAFVYSVLFHLLLMLAWELNRHYDLVGEAQGNVHSDRICAGRSGNNVRG